MAFKNLNDVFDPRLPLPIGGKLYYVPEGDAETGLWCTSLVAAAATVADGGEPAPPGVQLRFEGRAETAVQRRLLGEELFAELMADGIGKPTLDFITQTVVIWHAFGRDMAEKFWNAGGDSVDFQRAQSRAGRRARSTTSTSGAAARKTR